MISHQTRKMVSGLVSIRAAARALSLSLSLSLSNTHTHTHTHTCLCAVARTSVARLHGLSLCCYAPPGPLDASFTPFLLLRLSPSGPLVFFQDNAERPNALSPTLPAPAPLYAEEDSGRVCGNNKASFKLLDAKKLFQLEAEIVDSGTFGGRGTCANEVYTREAATHTLHRACTFVK